MWLGTRAGEARRFAIWATASLGAFLLVGPQLSAQGTPAGSQIRNWATLAYTSSGFGYVMPSDTVDLVVAQLAGVGLQAPQSSGASPGTAVVFAHTLSNLGNGPDSFSVAATSAHAWPLTLYRDVNSNGILDGGDSALTGPVALASGSTAALLVQIAIPASGSAGVTDTITVIATSGFDGAVSGSVRDLLSVSSAPIAFSVTKQVDRATAAVGDVLTYTLDYVAAGTDSASAVQLADTIPVGASYVAGTIRFNGILQTDAADGDAGRLVASGNGVVAVSLGTVAAGSAGSFKFQAADALEVGVGEAIPYTTTVRNPGTLTVTDLQIAVQLPVGARYVAGSVIGADSGVVAGGRLVLYSAAPLAPGTSRTLRYVAALISAPGTVAEARAVATGQVTGGLAGSPEAIAWVQIRRAWPMETRAAIGKVWVDANGDGRQGAGEGGLANVDIWTEDGMVATTDSTGKFSFTNVLPGRHAFRLDPRSIPDGYRLATEDIQLVDASGWTTPRVDFRLVATSARAGVATQPAPGANARDRHTLADAAPNARIGASRQTVEFSFAAVRLPDTAASKGLAFQHELPTPYRPMVRYDVSIRQSHGVALDAVVVFSPRADSAVVYVDGVQFTKYSWLERAIPIPFARPGAE